MTEQAAQAFDGPANKNISASTLSTLLQNIDGFCSDPNKIAERVREFPMGWRDSATYVDQVVGRVATRPGHDYVDLVGGGLAGFTPENELHDAFLFLTEGKGSINLDVLKTKIKDEKSVHMSTDTTLYLDALQHPTDKPNVDIDYEGFCRLFSLNQ